MNNLSSIITYFNNTEKCFNNLKTSLSLKVISGDTTRHFQFLPQNESMSVIVTPSES